MQDTVLDQINISYKDLISFSTEILMKVGCSKDEAEIAAIVLVEANLRGVKSHGVARLKRYVDDICRGKILPGKNPEIVQETPVSAVIEGHGGVGQYISEFAMDLAIKKAEISGVGMVTVRNSNHYGIAGYYAEKAARKGMIGFSATNSAPMVVPTFGKDLVLGTNPIAFAIPCNEKNPVLIDMATSVVPRGKIEVYERLGKTLPEGYATDETGMVCTDPTKVLHNMRKQIGGGLLPLGGEGEQYGGHKGYGLGLMVELLTGGLSLGRFSPDTYKNTGDMAHFFMCIRLDLFGNEKDIENHIKGFLDVLRNSKKKDGEDRIYIHGEKAFELRDELINTHISLDASTTNSLKELATKYGVELNEN